ncbi:MAG: helix-turn-helix transcriptional regulator [Clostridia bacterium]|nr:helix-turn-helix transcriptional regulator [Clostridia bacterium]
MKTIRQRKLRKYIANKQFGQVCTSLCLMVTLVLMAVYGLLTLQRVNLQRERMSDSADLLALSMQEKVTGMQSVSVYVSSLNNIDSLLVQRNPSISTFSEYTDVLQTVTGSELCIELMFHKSERILISDYGLSSYDTFFDQAFLQAVLAQKKPFEHWQVRTQQKNLYTGAQQVLSYMRSLPLASTQNNGCIIVSRPLSALAKMAEGYADAALGDYAVWLGDDLLLAASADPALAGDAQACFSSVEIDVRAAYWLPWRSVLAQSLPNVWITLCIWIAALGLCTVTALLLCRLRMEKLDALVWEMGGEWNLEEDYDDQVDQLYRIFESLTTELNRARQTTREGRPLLQEGLIGELLRTRVPIEQRRKNLDACGISLREPYFAVVQAVMEDSAPDGQNYLLVRRNVQTQLSAMGDVYSTYGDGSSILFLINTAEYAALNEKLEHLCETIHDAIKSFLSVDVAFSIGICTEENPHPHDAYVAARDRLSVLRLMDEQPQEAVVLSRSRPADHMHTEHLQQISDAVLSQDASALKTACSEVLSLYFPPDTDVREAHRRASVFLLRVCSLLAENELQLPVDMPGAALHQLQQQKTVADVQQLLQEWCQTLVSGSNAESNHYVEDAIAFVHKNYMHSLTVPEIGEKVNVNPIYLNRLFKEVTGATLSGYLSQYRCKIARQMLVETSNTVNEISIACGFSEVRSFVRFFKKYYDETPSEFQRRIKG